ncbi:DoxX family protein [Radicibacter daui]|uniref:DoxX family protein n=1 Tax=Radicibacter daui TaxID=3064829 RepID=UPI004046E259
MTLARLSECRHATTAAALYRKAAGLLETCLTPVALLVARLWLFDVFFSAGRARILNWQGQIFLFTDYHPLPLLPPVLWAVMTTTGELTLSCLAFIGLAGRFAGAGLLAMTMVIQFYLGVFLQSDLADKSEFYRPEHYLWMILELFLIARGAGFFSADEFLRRKVVPHLGL